MTHRIEFKPAAARQVRKLARRDQIRIIAKIETLADDPRPPGAEKLAGRDELYRVRVGDWRIIYQVQDEALLVLVVRVGHRRDVYRGV